MRGVSILVAVLSVTACTTWPSSHGDETNPTVTYRYYGDLYGTQFDEVSEEADNYCDVEFGKRSHLQDADDNGDDNLAVFECI